MVWVGTEDGLNRYDGSKFTQYRNVSGDSTSLAHNFVIAMFEDSHGHLFVGTHKGLQLHNPVTDKFTPPARTEDGQVFVYSCGDMIESEPDSIWVLRNARAKIVRADYDGIVVRPMEDTSSPIYSTGRGIKDVAGFQWLFDRRGMFRPNRANEIVSTHYELNDPVGLEAAVSMDGVLYAALFTKGLYRYNIIDDKFEKVCDPQGNSLFVRQIYADDKEPVLYLATDGRGLKKYNTETREFIDVAFVAGDLDCHKQKVHAICKDRGGNLWIAIFQKGVVMMPAQSDAFKYIGNKSVLSNLIGEDCVVALARDSGEGKLWVGVDNDGLYEIDMDNMTAEHYKATVPQVLSGLFVDSRGNLWVGSYTNGCGMFDRRTKKYNKLPLFDENKHEVPSVYDFAEDEQGNVWIATLGGGLFSYNLSTGEVSSGLRHSADKWFTSAHYSKNNNALYLGTYDGVIKIDSINSGGTGEKIFGGNIVHSVNESKDGRVWFATSNGLGEYDPADKSLKVYTADNGLPVNTVYGMEEDYAGQLWISTGNGLSQFDRSKGVFTNFFVDDGLQGNEFYKNASYKDSEGNIYFGGTNGITYFNPKEVVKPGQKWTVRLTGIYLHGNPVTGDMESGGRRIINGPVFDVSEIYLAHEDNSFFLEFGTEEFGNPESMVYQYSFDGNKWVTLPHATNLVNFSELSPGQHKLHIRTMDNGVLSDEKTVILNIGWPWYATGWVYLMYFIILCVIGVMIFRVVRNRKLKKREEMERLQAEQINEAKFQFFINISHEIRTPMSLVMSPLQKLMDSDDDSGRQKNYRLIQRNAKRVMRLVNELMDIRKIDKNKMKLTFTETLLTPFIADLYDLFHNAASVRGMEFTFNHQGCDDLKAWIDYANFDKIVMNLLSNAIKYTPDGGKIDISLSKGTDMSVNGPLRHYAEITVTDNGVGVADEEKKHIFERFYQAGNNTSGGTGVGLHLTYSLVKLHYGTIEVIDNPEGKGTRFIVRIPLGNEHLVNEKVAGPDLQLSANSKAKELEYSGLTPPMGGDDTEDGGSKGHKSALTVLVVEDDIDIRKYICGQLSELYCTEECGNGKDAYDMIIRKAPDLVISDVMMPEMDGLELTRQIRRNINLNHIPVILLTAKTREEDNIEALQSGADAYITKPFSIDVLMSTVANLICSRKRLKNTFSGRQTQDEKLAAIEAVSYDDKLMEKVMKVINDNISNPEITVEMLADEVGLSRVHLHRRLKELTNQSPRDFIRNSRLRLSTKLLVETGLSVGDVASRVGFKNANNFTTAFKVLYGMSPTEYIEQNRASLN